jgi:prepilin-type N-terminal cleavage/methylation domain-containing protein
MKNSRGFTLIEVMVALSILAVLSMLSAQAMKSAVDNRVTLSADITRDQKLADTFRVMRSDIANAFHYRDTHVKMINEMLKPGPTRDPNATPDPKETPTPPPTPTPPEYKNPLGTPRPTPVQITNFVGEAESLYFTSTTNLRTIRDAQESDLAKIGYFTKSCTSTGPRGGGASKCLYRSVSPYLDEDVTKGGKETMLVEHVEEFKMRYLGPEQEDYVPTWKTDNNGTEQTKDIFPYAVEITLTLYNKEDKKDKPVTGTVLAPINFPNNEKKKKPPTKQFDDK